MEIMSFNIRCDVGTTLVGESDYWPRREYIVTEMFKVHKPDIIGIQELMDHQIPSVLGGLGENYDWAGEHRDGPGKFGERNAIFYNTDTVKLHSSTTYALSDIPNTLGSVTWGNQNPRIVTQMQFQDKVTGKLFLSVNTHFDHISEYSKIKSAQMIKNLLLGCKRVIVMGDFNSPAQKSTAYAILTQKYRDTFLAAKRQSGDWGTFGNYKEPVAHGDRLDWILCTPDFAIDKSSVMPYNLHGEYPSDHYPVTATLNF